MLPSSAGGFFRPPPKSCIPVGVAATRRRARAPLHHARAAHVERRRLATRSAPPSSGGPFYSCGGGEGLVSGGALRTHRSWRVRAVEICACAAPPPSSCSKLQMTFCRESTAVRARRCVAPRRAPHAVRDAGEGCCSLLGRGSGAELVGEFRPYLEARHTIGDLLQLRRHSGATRDVTRVRLDLRARARSLHPPTSKPRLRRRC